MKITAFLTAALAGAVTASDSVYLVNSYKGSEISSGIAYYANGHPATEGSRPDDYVDVTHGSNVIWEGRTVKGTFGSGVSFTSNIFADAGSKQVNAWCGLKVKSNNKGKTAKDDNFQQPQLQAMCKQPQRFN